MSIIENKVMINNLTTDSRKTKEWRFKKERIEILNKINKILEVSENNNKFYLYDMTDDKKKQIEDLKDDVKKYFKSSSTRLFSKEVDKEYLALIKIVFKESGYELNRSMKTIVRDNKKNISPCYIIEKLINPPKDIQINDII